MNIAAYCRVSTDTSDQLNSLETQKRFFEEYAQSNGHTLVRIYADEGISGTKIKNRTQFQRLMRDAHHGLFQMVVSKDVSRLARNTVDFLQSIRELKALHIEMLFLTSNMSVLGNSEFVLTMLAAIAQEESSNTSKRIKFAKELNAKNGRVPNLVYGYNKTKGDYFNLTINEAEAKIIRRIYGLYIDEGCGASKIAARLNAEGVKTKRDCDWSQNAVSRILSNPLYTGKIINGKQEITDFLTGVRKNKDESDWMVTERPDLRIVDDDSFRQAQKIVGGRKDAFQSKGERHSNRHLFSTLIKCADCGHTFRRIEKTYKNTYVRWVCNGRNMNGAKTCGNRVAIDESELTEALREYFTGVLLGRDDLVRRLRREFTRVYQSKENNESYEQELCGKLLQCEKRRKKYMDMFADDLISREEVRQKVGILNAEIEKLENNLKLIHYNLKKEDRLEDILQNTFKTVEDIISMETLTNANLKRIIEKIIVDHEGNVDIHLRLFGDIGLDEKILISDDRT